MERSSFDVIVVGSGGAGLRAALAAREQGSEVCVISKGPPGMGTCTIMSGGVFFGHERGGSRPEEHMGITLVSGRGMCDEALVEVLAGDAPGRIRELESWGLKGTAMDGRFFTAGKFLGWGKNIIRCLTGKVREAGIHVMSSVTAARMVTRDGASVILAWSTTEGKWVRLSARAVVLATGGAGALFARHDNPRRMLGDGYTLAFEAGAELRDMEFVQFYPLAIAEKGISPIIYVPPNLGDKGILRNAKGENILQKYAITDRPAAIKARDKLSQAIFREVAIEGGEVTIDLTGVSREQWCSDPYEAATWDILGERCGAWKRPLRVAPAGHHVMGGARIDEWGRSTVPGLFACGEAAGGVHGANRNGGNGLTEMIVFGARAGNSAGKWAKAGAGKDRAKLAKEVFARAPRGSSKDVSAPGARALLSRVQTIMWEHGGIVRERGGLSATLIELDRIMARAETLPFGTGRGAVEDLIDLRNAARAAQLIVMAALAREESRGAHYRTDFPRQDDAAWKVPLIVKKSDDGTPVVTRADRR